jgi:hypothetical protein
MRDVTIDGKKYTLRGLREVTHLAKMRVENLVSRLFFDSVDMSKFMEKSGKKNEDKALNEVFSQLLKNTEKFVDFLRITNFDDSIKDIMAVMLTTDMDYDHIMQMPEMPLQDLIGESKKEIGGFEDFSSSFNINTELNLTSMMGTMTEKTQKKD